MAIDRNAFIDNFTDELNENIKLIDTTILLLKKDPENEEELAALLRAFHTVKGSARMLKFLTVEKIAHGIENVFKGVKDKRYEISKPLIQLVFLTTDYLKEAVRKIRTDKDDELPVRKLLHVYERAAANEPYSIDGLKLVSEREQQPDGPAAEKQPSGGAQEQKPRDQGSPVQRIRAREPAAAESASAEKPAVKREQPPLPEEPRSASGSSSSGSSSSGGETIRIKIDKIDGIIKLLNNLIIKQFQFKKENDTLSELESVFREIMHSDLGSDRTGVMKNAEYSKRENDCLKLIQSVRKRFSEELTLLERNTFEVQEEILSLRMLPLDLILGSLGKMVEETAMSLQKEIDLTITGSDVMLDKIILEKLNDPIIHIVRNAVDHGLETPEEREKAGKPRTGRMEIRCYSESGNIIIRIKDDGRGIDYDRIRQKALQNNPMQEEEIRGMDNSALNAFLFSSGFSTNEEITELSGRGVGLDIVRYNIEQIKGKITLTSERGKGTEFILSLPLSLATVEGFFIESSGEKFLLPSNFVKEIIIIKEEDKLDLLNRKAIKLRDKIIPIYQLADVLEKESFQEPSKIFVIVVESLGEMIGVVVDAVIQYASLIYKPLPKNLMNLKLMQGIVFDESFNIINIMHIPELINKFKSVRNIESRKRFSTDRREYKHILVVDDSFSTREIEKSILELENYNVVTAVDGIDALDKIQEQHFNLIVTDIHMPRMDGLTFIENLRREDKYRSVPVIVVSSDKDKDKRQKFLSVGADSFIDKSDFDRGNLILEVKKLIG